MFFSDLFEPCVFSDVNCCTDKTTKISSGRRGPKKSWNIAGLKCDTMAVLLLVISLFIYLFITYYVKLHLLLFNIGFLTFSSHVYC